MQDRGHGLKLISCGNCIWQTDELLGQMHLCQQRWFFAQDRMNLCSQRRTFDVSIKTA